MTKNYTQDQAAAIFRQFSDGDPRFTMYYPDGTPADALNTGTQDFGSYNVGPSDRDTLIQNPWAPTKNNPGYSGYLHPIDQQQLSLIEQIEQDIKDQLKKLPWGWIAVGAIAIVVAPMIVHEAVEPTRARRRRRRRA